MACETTSVSVSGWAYILATGFTTTACGAFAASRARAINKCMGPAFRLTPANPVRNVGDGFRGYMAGLGVFTGYAAALARHEQVVEFGIAARGCVLLPRQSGFPKIEVRHAHLVVALALQDQHGQRAGCSQGHGVVAFEIGLIVFAGAGKDYPRIAP